MSETTQGILDDVPQPFKRSRSYLYVGGTCTFYHPKVFHVIEKVLNREFFKIKLRQPFNYVNRKWTSYRPTEEGEWLSDLCKLRDSSCFGIFRGSIFRIDLVIKVKDKLNPYFGSKLGPKAIKLFKIHISPTVRRRKLVDPSKWTQDLIYYGCSKICIPLQQPKVP